MVKSGRPFRLIKVTKVSRTNSPERSATEKMEPHKIKTPFKFYYAHTHQEEDAKTNPSIFLACAKNPENNIRSWMSR